MKFFMLRCLYLAFQGWNDVTESDYGSTVHQKAGSQIAYPLASCEAADLKAEKREDQQR